MNIKLGCRLCNYAVESAKALTDHIHHVHKGQFVEGGLTMQEAEDVLSTLAANLAKRASAPTSE